MKAWIGGIVFFGLVALLALGAHDANTPEGKARAADRAQISKCRDAQNDELSDLSTRRFMRQACDQMENDYRAKWGMNP